MLPMITETPVPTDEIFEALTVTGDSGFAGVPFVPGEWSVLNWVYLLLLVGWVGVILLTAYTVKVTPNTSLRELDADHLTVMVAWVGLISLTAYTLRILQGP